jgi:hypothetical protein
MIFGAGAASAEDALAARSDGIDFARTPKPNLSQSEISAFAIL